MFDKKDLKRIVRNFPLMVAEKTNYGLVKKDEKKGTLSINAHPSTPSSSDYLEKHTSKSNGVTAPRNDFNKPLSATKDQDNDKRKSRKKSFNRINENFMKSEKYLSGKAVLAELDRDNNSGESAYLKEAPPLRNENGELVEEMELLSYRDVVRNRMLPQNYDV